MNHIFPTAYLAALTSLTFSACKPGSAEVANSSQPADSSIQITVHPSQTRSIAGISEVNRNAYFALCDEGAWFEKSLKNEERFDYLTNELGVKMGRMLGPVQRHVLYTKAVKEDPNRPGFADINFLKTSIEGKSPQPSAKMSAYFGDNLDVAAHGNHHAFPKFMGEFYTDIARKDKKPESIPDNLEAAAELSAAVFKYGFNDFTRPRYYEPLNEPHWSYYSSQKLADWHLITHEKVKVATPDVLVGGLCMAVPYLYKDQYRIWNEFRAFMDNTKGKLDFYSLHVYDYYENKEAGRNKSRISSGLPFEGMLDLINNHAVNTLGQEVDLVISEHGGYTLNRENRPQAYDGEPLALSIYDEYVPKEEQKEGFAGELERRSIVAWMHLDTIVSNTLTFMDSPHTVKKAVPFILVNTEAWDSKYYASIYVPQDYEKGAEWNESFLLNFYKFFRGVDGRRIVTESHDPDLQVRSFANGKQVYTVVKNLSLKEHTFTLNGLDGATHEIRHISRGPKLIPSYTEDKLDSLKGIQLNSRDNVMIVSTFEKEVQESSVVEEKIFYGNKIALKTAADSPKLEFTVDIPEASKAKNAILRLSISRPKETGYEVTVLLNGETLEVPLEDSADRLYDEVGGYATTKMISLKTSQLKDSNTITVTFPDGKDGAAGTAVIRAQFQ